MIGLLGLAAGLARLIAKGYSGRWRLSLVLMAALCAVFSLCALFPSSRLAVVGEPFDGPMIALTNLPVTIIFPLSATLPSGRRCLR